MRNFIKNSLLILTMGTFVFFVSCKEDEEPAKSEATFSTSTGTVAENATAPVSVTINFNQALQQNGTIDVSITSNGTYTEDYSTNPDGSTGTFELSGNVGDEFKTFTVTPVDNSEYDDTNVTITFTLENPTGGIVLGTGTTFTLTIQEDEEPAESLPFNAGFNECSTGLPSDWQFVSAASDADWECTSDTRGVSEEAGDYAIEANGFGGSEAANDWAVSPAIDLGSGATKMNFYSLKRFDDAEDGLKVLISTDYDGAGDPTTATWTDITTSAVLDTDNGDFFYQFSGDIDLSSYSGVVNIAFQYLSTGTGGGSTEQWRIDELNVVEGAPSSITVTETLTAFAATDNGSNSASQSYTVAGANLTEDVTVTASNHFELSLNDTDWSSSVVLNSGDLNAGSVTVYVRFSPTSGFDQVINGTISHESPEVIAEEIEVSGTETGNAGGTVVQINEIHYDNIDADQGEFVEVVVTGTDIAAQDLANYYVVKYNGSDGNYYTDADLAGSSETLDNFTRTEDQGNFYYVWDLPANGLQNGSPDGLALVGPNGLIQFLSYEGTMVANEGAANGVTSTDIGVEESNASPVGSSLQRKADGTWEYTEGTNTKGAKNANE